MAAVMLQVIPSFIAKFSKNSIFNFVKTFVNYIVSKDYCIAKHDAKICLSHICRYHNLLLGNFEELLQKLDPLCFTFQHVECLYTLVRYQFSGKLVVKCVQVFDDVQKAVYFNQRNRGVDRMPSIPKKRLSRKKQRKHFLSFIQKTNLTQTSGSVFAERIEQIKKTKNEHQPVKIADCFLDGYGCYSGNLVTFGMELWQAHQFLLLEELQEGEVVAQRKKSSQPPSVPE